MVTIEDGGEVSRSRLESLARYVACVRVGVTVDPKSRRSQYQNVQSGMFLTAGVYRAVMYYALYQGYGTVGYMKEQEQRLLDITSRCRTAKLNEQRKSNYPNKYTQGYLYVIHSTRDIEQGGYASDYGSDETEFEYDIEQGYPRRPHPERPYPERPVADFRMSSKQKVLLMLFLIALCGIGLLFIFVIF
jgi:hypothetical protein